MIVLNLNMFPSLTMSGFGGSAKPHVMFKRTILIFFIATCFAQILGHHDAHSDGGEETSLLSCQTITDEPACKCEMLEDINPVPSCVEYCAEIRKCMNLKESSKLHKRPYHNVEFPWDRNYVNLYTPMPDGGLVVSDDRMHADLRITSPNQTCK